MTGFDVFAGAILLVSGLVGLVRGATRELTTVIAFVVAAAGAIFTLRYSGRIARHLIHTPWLAHVAALLVVFAAIYIVVRLIGGHITRGVRQTGLSGFDRALGFAIGLARGAVAIGLVALLIRVATPAARTPDWFTHSRIYPMADAAGATLRALAPKGVAMAKHVGPTVENALTSSESDAGGATANSGPSR